MKVTMLLEEYLKEIATYHKEWQSLFVWHDGPLVQAMRNGDMFLVDEISLAEDSVLERLNSVLEPKRLLVITKFRAWQSFVLIFRVCVYGGTSCLVAAWCC